MVKKKVLLLLMLACVVLWPVVSFGADANAVKDLFAQAQAHLNEERELAAMDIYRQIAAGDVGGNDGLSAQEKLIRLYVRHDQPTQARTAYEYLMANFSENENLAAALENELASAFRESGTYKTALEIYQYMIAAQPNSKSVIGWRTGLIKCYVGLGDNPNARAEQAKLFTDYANHPSLAGVVGDLAYDYRSQNKWAKSRELYEYYLANWPQNKNAMLSARYAAKASIKLGDYAKADQAIDSMILTYADNPKIGSELTELADDYRGQNKWAQARELYEYCLKNWPQSEDAMRLELYVAMATIKLGEYEKADQAIDSLASTYADNPEIGSELTELADAYGSQNKWAKARELYEYCLTNWPQSEDAMRLTRYVARATIKLGEYEKADQAISDMISTYGSDPKIGSELTELADDYATDRNYEKAASLYTQVVDTWPASEGAVPAQTRLARMYIEIGDYTNAAQATEKLKKNFATAPNIAAAIEDIGDMYQLNYSQREAYAAYKYVLEQWPTFERAIWVQTKAIFAQVRLKNLDQSEAELSNLLNDFTDHKDLAAMIHEVVEEYRNAGLYEEGRGLFEYILENWTQDEATNLELQVGLALQSIKLKELDKAQTAVDKVIADYNDHPNIAKGLFQVAEEYYYARNYRESINLLETIKSSFADEAFPTKVEVPFVLGACHERLKEYDEAIAYYSEQLERYPKSKFAVAASYQIGMIYMDNTYENENAIQSFEQHAILYPDSGTVESALYRIGSIYLRRLHEYQKAADTLELCSQKYPEGNRTWACLSMLARCQEKLGKNTEALKTLELLLEKTTSENLRQDVQARIYFLK